MVSPGDPERSVAGISRSPGSLPSWWAGRLATKTKRIQLRLGVAIPSGAPPLTRAKRGLRQFTQQVTSPPLAYPLSERTK